MSSIKSQVIQICNNAKNAASTSFALSNAVKNAVLQDAANLIISKMAQIIEANQCDLNYARQNNLDGAKIDRLTLDENRIKALAASLEDIIALPDPCHKILHETHRLNGLYIRKITTSIGVMFAIFESRPNVAADIAALTFKAGNAVILRSGSESVNSAKILTDIIKEALIKNNVDENFVQFINSADRTYVKYLLKMDDMIDVVIPRGGKSLIEMVMKNTKIPVFKHLDGNCHTYIHESADIQKARQILLNAKLRRTGICGATESLLIDRKIAKKILPLVAHDLYTNGCEMRGDNAARKLDSRILPATKKDYYTEYLDKIISIKITKNIDEAINHINKYSSAHTEAIICEEKQAAEKFFSQINSAIVMHNASTQFADGGEFGMGAEVGISTGKLHARGPVGLEQLVTYKYLVDAECGLRKM